jgi:hypothetical protein
MRALRARKASTLPDPRTDGGGDVGVDHRRRCRRLAEQHRPVVRPGLHQGFQSRVEAPVRHVFLLAS